MASREGGREARPFFGNVAISGTAMRFLDALRAAIQSVRGLHSPGDQWQANHDKGESTEATSPERHNGTAKHKRTQHRETHE